MMNDKIKEFCDTKQKAIEYGNDVKRLKNELELWAIDYCEEFIKSEIAVDEDDLKNALRILIYGTISIYKKDND